jgi:ABC-type antimicrobial peptide transport system permease subunit
MTVQGVVEDVMLANFTEQTPDPLVYLPVVGQTATSWIVGTPAYVVRTARAETIAPEIREVIRSVAPEAPMYRVFTMASLAARSMAALSFTMLTLFVAAGVALILGAVGLYGVLSYVVSQRKREIGIRMALGAQASGVRRLIVAQGLGVALVGVVIGLIAALALTRVLDSLLFGVEANHVATFLAMSAVMAGVALLASYGPARRASGADPIAALRAE